MAYNEFDDIENVESGRITFDFKGYLFKILNLWKFVLICIGTALIIAYLINVRKESVYKLESLISVENDQNPFFTANTSISFNWGGVSDKMGKTMTTLQTRTHNEKVVDSLQFYMNYLMQGKYKKIDAYKAVPFIVDLETGCKAMVKDIEKEVANSFVPTWPWALFRYIARIAPLSMLAKMS